VISLRNRVHLAVPADRVWACFGDMEHLYDRWIPEHLRWRWLFGEPLAKGTIWHADEWVGPMRINARFQVIECEPGRYFSWRILSFPAALVRTRGSFRFSPSPDGGCDMDQEVHLGFRVPVVAQVLDLAMRLVLPLAEFRRHMRDEGDNLIHLISSRSPAGDSQSAPLP